MKNPKQKPKYIVSACLAGENCRYNGGSKPCPEIIAMARSGLALPLCPEKLAKLPIPRLPAEIQGKRVIAKDGRDLTAAFEQGAAAALAIACKSGCKKAILKANSPSCGLGAIHDGSFTGRLIAGNGIFAQLLLNAGFAVWTEKNWPAPNCDADQL